MQENNFFRDDYTDPRERRLRNDLVEYLYWCFIGTPAAMVLFTTLALLVTGNVWESLRIGFTISSILVSSAILAKLASFEMWLPHCIGALMQGIEEGKQQEYERRQQRHAERQAVEEAAIAAIARLNVLAPIQASRHQYQLPTIEIVADDGPVHRFVSDGILTGCWTRANLTNSRNGQAAAMTQIDWAKARQSLIAMGVLNSTGDLSIKREQIRLIQPEIVQMPERSNLSPTSIG